MVNSIVDPFLYVLGRSKILPKDYLYSCCLGIDSERVPYLSLVLACGYIVRVLGVGPNVMRLVLDISLEVILVVGIIRRDLDSPNPLIDSSGLPT